MQNTPSANRFQKSGFTLIEMTIVIVIASVIVAGALALARPYFAQQQIEKTASAVRSVENAIKEFVEINGRYPCPAPLNTPRGNSNDGIENCTADGVGIFASAGQVYTGSITRTNLANSVLIGAVPYRTLDVPVSATIDAFSNRLTYAISRASTVAGTYDDDLSDLTSSAALEILNEGGNSISQRDLNDDGVADPLSKHYYFFSHGSDGAGSFTNAGVANGTACGGTFDAENCDRDGRFVAAARSLGTAAQYNDDVSNESIVMDENLSNSLWARTPTNDEDIYNLNDRHVGIGTETPATMLHVSSTGATAQLQLERSGESVWIDPNNGDGDQWAQMAFDDGMSFQFVRRNENAPGPADDTWTSLLSLLNNGNFGIGDEFLTPQEKLHVVGDFVQDLSPAGPQRYDAATTGNGLGLWTHLGMMDNGPGSTGPNNDSNQYGFRVNWDSDQLVMGLEDNGSNRKDGVIGLRTGELNQDYLRFEIDGNKLVSMRAVVDSGVNYPGPDPVVGLVGIGLPNPGRILDVNRNIRIRSAGAEWWTSLDIWHNTDTAGHNPAVTMYRGRGTHEAPTGSLLNDVIGVFDARGTPSVIQPLGPGYGAGLVMKATQNHGLQAMGTDLHLLTVENDNYSARTRMKIDHDGQVFIGPDAAPATPEARLEVRGQIKIFHDGLSIACDATKEGSQRYNPTLKLMEFCDGQGAWKTLGGGLYVDSGTVEHGDIIPLPAGATNRSSCEVTIGVHSIYAEGDQGLDEIYCAQDPGTGEVTSWFSKEDNGRFYNPGTVWCSYMILCRN